MAPTRRGNRRPKPATRTRATRVLAQGAGAAPRRAFGATRTKKKILKGKVARNGYYSLRAGLNARLPTHLGLPRPVGPYTVIRTTTLHTSSARVLIFSPIMNASEGAHDAPIWYQACGYEDINSTLAINAVNNTSAILMPMSGLGSAAEVVPAALTVQVMNEAALNNANGLFAMARVNQQLNLGGETRTWDTFADEFVSYYRPRLLTGGKLALRGVTSSAYPLNMNEFSLFAGHSTHTASPFTWGAERTLAALSPIVFVQKTGTPVDVNFMVTIEWRVRFDPFHPATSSHSYHPATPDGVWNRIIGTMSTAGHGVEDIADEIAELGAAVGVTGVAGAALAA